MLPKPPKICKMISKNAFCYCNREGVRLQGISEVGTSLFHKVVNCNASEDLNVLLELIFPRDG